MKHKRQSANGQHSKEASKVSDTIRQIIRGTKEKNKKMKEEANIENCNSAVGALGGSSGVTVTSKTPLSTPGNCFNRHLQNWVDGVLNQFVFSGN